MAVPAVSRTLDIIEVFSKLRRPMTVSALAKALGLPASSCHGIVKTLEERGYLVDLKGQGGYYFTKRLQVHAERIGGFDPLPAWIFPALSAMRDAADETVLVAKLSGDHAVYLEVLESAQSVRYIAQVGDTRPLHASAAGKALLGAMAPERRHQLIEKMDLPRRNARTIATPRKLAANIEEGLAKGWFMTQGEYHTDVSALAVPFQLEEQLYAAVIAGPAARMKPRLAAHVKLLLAFAARAEQAARIPSF